MRWFLSALCAMFFAVASSVHAAPRYTITRIGRLDATASGALINNSGQIAITYAPQNLPGEGDENGHVDLLSGGLTITLPFAGQYAPGASSLSNNGHLTGTVKDADGVYRTFRFNGANVADLGTFGGDGSIGNGINDDGDVVGWRWSGPTSQGFLLRNDGSFEVIPTLGGHTAYATDINAHGDVVGLSSVAGESAYEAFYYDGVVAVSLGVLGGTSSAANAINDAGEIVGSALGSTGVHQAALFSLNDTPIELAPLWFRSSAADINFKGEIIGAVWENNDDPSQAALFDRVSGPSLLESLIQDQSGWLRLVSATAINDRSEIVGLGVYEGVPGLQAFLMLPVPEPNGIALLIAGLAFLPAIRCRVRSVCDSKG